MAIKFAEISQPADSAFGLPASTFLRQRPGIISSKTPLKYSVSGIVGKTG